jgi:disulfide bond formation protein DsbB
MNNKAMQRTYFLGFIFILFLQGIAWYLEYFQHVLPCPLCIFQRIIMGVLAIWFFLGFIFYWKKAGYLILAFLSFITAVAGLAFAGRQVYLQYLPPKGLGECGLSFSAMFKFFSFFDAIQNVWRGGTECSEFSWTFLSLSLAEWSLISFSIVALLTLWQIKRAIMN